MKIHYGSLFLALLSTLVLGGGWQFAQAQLSAEKIHDYAASSAPGPEQTGIMISKRVDEVNLIFTVTDRHGRFVEKLPASAFQVRDNHMDAGPLKYFQQQSNLPLRVALLIDLSDSIRDRFEFEKKAAAVFFRHILRPKMDKAIVIGFNGTVHVEQPLTSDVEKLVDAISGLKAGGDTAFNDAVRLAVEQLESPHEQELTRKAIIVISDGADTASQGRLEAAEEASLQSGVVIFALSTNSIYEPNAPGSLILKKLTDESGGYVLPAHESYELKAAFRQIEKALRSQYAMGYKPTQLEPNGALHSIEIMTERKGLRVQCRKGYFAPRMSPF